jgi:iron complex transport system substrate-binding protein
MYPVPAPQQSRQTRCLKLFSILLIILILAAGCISATETRPTENESHETGQKALKITDVTGQKVTVGIPVRRIVSLNAATTEMLVSIGAKDQIVGVADFIIAENHPGMKKRLSNAASVGLLTSPDIETILRLQPDVLMAYVNKPLNYDQMHASNITILQMSCYLPEELPGNARTLGTMTGHEAEAERYARFMERYLLLVRERVENIPDRERPRVYMEYVNDFTAYGPGSGADQILSILRAKNIAENLKGQNVLVSREWVLEQDPDIIIKSVAPMKGNFTILQKELIDRNGFSSVRAVMNGKVYCMSTGLVTTPRSVIGLLFLGKALYPDRFSDIDPEAVLEEYKREFGTGDDETDIFYPSDPGVNRQAGENGDGVRL